MRSSVLVTLPVLAFATYGKDDGLARCDSHDSREDSLVEIQVYERVKTILDSLSTAESAEIDA
jgi:hypothetical protein